MSLPLSHDQQEAIKRAIEVLNQGGLVAIPTETVYGLAADASNEDAIAQVFSLKGRPSDRPLIVHLGHLSWLEQWATHIPSDAVALAKAFWPGPLTLVLPKHSHVSPAITGGQATVAVRVPNHPMALALLQGFGRALVAPSANRYGHISPTSAGDVKAEFGEDAPLVLDGGSCEIGIESTIVSCLSTRPRVLRVGSISSEALTAVTGRLVEVGANDEGEVGHVVVPGQVLRHYAPRTPTRWLSEADGVLHDIQRAKVGFLGFSEPDRSYEHCILLPQDPALAAQRLYASLRALDDFGLDQIVIESPPSGDEWAALRDRLDRATAKH